MEDGNKITVLVYVAASIVPYWLQLCYKSDNLAVQIFSLFLVKFAKKDHKKLFDEIRTTVPYAADNTKMKFKC